MKEPSAMMKHYLQTKENYKDCIVFYRLGDFYELFYDDAIEISNVLDLTLTHKSCGLDEKAPMCGVPYHAAENYIAKLVALGYKVAICEQLSEPKKGVKVVERDVVRVVTAGTVTDDNMLEERKNNYIMSLYISNDKLSAVYCDITTGEMNLCHFDGGLESNFSDLLNRVMPSQIIGDSKAKEFYNALPILKFGVYPKFEEYFEYAYAYDKAKENVCLQFGDNAINVFELKSNKQDVPAVGGLLEYLKETQKRTLKNISKITKVRNDQFMIIDMNTRRNLELVESIRERKKYGSLLWLLDKTKTSIGARRFRSIFDQPLQSSTEINERLDSVEELTKNLILRDRLSESLANIKDIERIAGKIAYGNVLPNDLLQLKNSLAELPKIKSFLINIKTKKLTACRENLVDFSQIVELLDKAIKPKPPALLKEGGYINDGFNQELDDLRHAKATAKRECELLEEKEKELTGIKNLKIHCNSVFGYYIEVSKGQTELVPLRYVRKQTIANAERYTTEDLQKIEDKIFNSVEYAIKLEEKLYKTLIEYLTNYLSAFAEVSKNIAEIDMLLSLAECSVKYNFCKPVINRNVKQIKIEQGRHPIVEQFVKENFISNDTLLDNDENKMAIITGPNMAGKSTFMRQVALIVFMAHIGSFVPAKYAEIAITDRIFTRVGASDDLAFGQSTFMVEMSEVANILANATDKSLVVLDEIGRGTSTFDGLSIAWAVVEYISKNLNCKTLFATHYHELSELEGVIRGVKNYKITVKEMNDTIVFLRKIVRGHANKSFGVEVAQLAGVPQKVVDRAKEISLNLEKVNQKLDMNIFGEDEEKTRQEKNNKLGQKILSILRDIDINRMSPIEAFEILHDLIDKSKSE
ncbi:MAG: DNA mismatch repair protein MutS [Clostridiales bacterium]|nr:DNA mismatch repair protein MutS [Clostridiales bacterium]